MCELTIFDFPDLLPNSVHEIAAVIGEEAAQKLLDRYSGASIQIGAGKQETDRFLELIDTIGEEAAFKMCRVFRNESVYIPLCIKAEQAVRNYKLIAEFDQLTTQSEPLSATRAVEFLAPKYGISDRMTWHILKKPLPPHR